MLALATTIIGSDSAHNSTAPFNPANSLQDTKGLLLGAIFGILAFIGFEAASALGEEARDPRSTVPKGVLYSCIGIGLYYIYCCYAWVVGSNPDIVAFHAKTEGNDWIQFAHDHWGALWWIVFLALVNSNLACGAAAVNNAGRVLFAMGRTGSLPSFIGKVHPKHRTPYVGVIVTLVLSSIVSFVAGGHWGPVLGFSIVGGMFTILAIVIYMLACVACIGFFTRKPEGMPYKNVLLHIVCPVLGPDRVPGRALRPVLQLRPALQAGVHGVPAELDRLERADLARARRRRHAVHALGEPGGTRPGHACVRRRVERAGPRRAGRVDVDLALAHFRLPVRGAAKRGRSGGKAMVGAGTGARARRRNRATARGVTDDARRDVPAPDPGRPHDELSRPRGAAPDRKTAATYGRAWVSGVARRRRDTDVMKVPGTKEDIAVAINVRQRDSMSSTCQAPS